MSLKAPLEQKVELQVISLRASNRDYQALAINLLQPRELIRPEELSLLEICSQLNCQQGLILYGQAPIWLYSHLVWRCQQAAWVACYDIRTHSAVVVSSRVPEWQSGDTIPIIPNNPPGSAILIGGPPNSGKSVLSHALRVSLLEKRPDVKIYVHRANWDGEGTHTYQTPNTELALKLKRENNIKLHQHPNKDELIGRYFDYQAEATKNIRQVMDLVLVDVGGVPDPVKMPVVEKCSHYIVISKDSSEVQKWHDLCGARLQPLAVIHSVLEKQLEVLQTEPFLEIVAGPWKRQELSAVPEALLQAVLKLLP